MKNQKLILLTIGLLSATLATAQFTPNFQPLADSFEVENPSAVQAINIVYDDIDPKKQLFHILLPDMEGNHPLVIFIHGGGFTGGDPGIIFKDPERRATAKYFLDNGFAFASFGYRLIAENEPDNEGVIKSLMDAKRALQFVRYYADDLFVDPDQIALTGGSAGGGTSIWLASHSDMADPEANDPILQESTRVKAVFASGSQSTYDLFKWETEVYENFDGQGTNFTLDSIAEIMTTERIMNFYGGMDSIDQMIHDPALVQYREEVDMLAHLSDDDPPLYIFSQSGAIHPSDDVLHHWLHSNEVYEAAVAAQLSEVKVEIKSLSLNTTEGESGNEFLLRQLGGPFSVPQKVLGIQPTLSAEIFPNPAQDYFQVSLHHEELSQIEVSTLSGTIVHQQSGSEISDRIDTSLLHPAIYLVRLTSTSGTRTIKRLIVD